LLVYTPTLEEPCPPWVYATWGAGLFLYQAFDACDGKQARKLGLSGPLGECFDHGVDALNTTLEVILFAAATGLGQSWATLLSQFGTLCNFYLTTWEEYHTGVLFLGYFNGPVEGILMITIYYFVTAFKGPEFWSQTIFDLIPIDPPFFFPKILADLPLNYHFLVFSAISLGANIIQSSLNVINARRKSNQPIAPALLGLSPFFVVSAVAYTFLTHHEEIVHQHLLPTMLYLGIVFAYTVGTIIIGHVAKKDFPYWNILFLPLFLGLADVYITPHFREEPYISGEYVLGTVLMAFGLSLGVYGGFVIDCIFTMCDYLDMNCLTVKKKDKDGGRKKRI